MKLRALELRNWCQHAYKRVEFSNGLSAVIGQNGSGKSNLLGGLRFALTGENPNYGKQEANIYQLAPATERAYVQLELELQGKLYTVKRHLRPASEKTTLECAGEPTVRGEKQVNPALAQRLATDMRLINRHVLVAQGDIFAFLAEEPAERKKSFQHLFDTEDAEEGYQAIVAFSVAVPETGVVLDDLRRELETLQTTARGYQEEIARFASLPELQQQREQQRQIIVAYEQHCRVERQLSAVRANQAATQSQVNQLREALQPLESDLVTLLAAANGAEPDALAAKVALKNWDFYQAQQGLLRAAKDGRLLAIKAMSAPEPVRPEGEHDLLVLQRHLANLREARQRDEAFLQQFDNTGVAACPTCHRDTADLHVVVEDTRNGLPDLKRNIARVEEQLQAVDRYQTQRQHWLLERQHYQEKLNNWDQRIAELSREQPPEVDPEALRQQVAVHTEYAEAAKQLQSVVQTQQRELSRLEGTLATLGTQVQQLESELRLLNTTAENATLAGTTIQRIDERVQWVQAQTTELTRAQALAQSVAARLTAAEAVEAKAAKVRSWQARMQPWKTILHRDGAPKYVAYRNLQRLQLGVNDLLGCFDAGFRVEADESLSFTAYLPDGSAHPAMRLSGGQKVMLAMAFRVAVNAMFASQVGVLVLDEPTAYLDAHHIQTFAAVLTRMRELTTERGLQCIIVTHEQELAHLFDTVIQLP